MADIVLATLNAKFIHSAFGLRYLMANLGRLQPRACLLEFDLQQRPVDVAAAILDHDPAIVGLGVYIWNASASAEVVAILKRLRPELTVILGGPEVSFETERQPMIALADHVLTGEADQSFARVCRDILEGKPPAERVLPSPLPDPASLVLPYDLYDDRDIAHRILYVEASRGCPFTCEFCLSSLEVPVRAFPLRPLLEQLGRLLDRGVRQFKFVDRTFNLNLATSQALLQFFLDRMTPGLFLHFEMIPDRLPAGLREIIARFPAGSLQFEVGIQSFNETVCARIRRRQNVSRLEENLRFLRGQTGVHVHADLIVGLPGESMESFGAGFDRLVALGPQEIQIGLLKRLRGTPIVRHDREWEMVYNPHPPYELLQNRLLGFRDLLRLRRFARYWDLVANSGNFTESTPRLWQPPGRVSSPFQGFLAWSDWLWQQARRTDAIALARLVHYLFRYLTEELHHSPREAAASLARDYLRPGRRDLPECLRPFSPPAPLSGRRARSAIPSRTKRQVRHRL